MRAAAIAYPPSVRVVAAALVVLSRGSLLLLAAMVLFLDAWLGAPLRVDNPLRLLRAFASFFLVPGIAAWTVGRAFAATVAVQRGLLVVERVGTRVEVPCDAVDRIVPWRLALPSGGVWLRLASGRWFPWGLQLADPVALVEAIAGAGAPERVRGMTQHPALVYARSKPSRRWFHLLVKFPAVALVPTLPLFRLHQWITYGGTFGEYHAYGLQAYLAAFGIYWAMCTMHLVLYAAVLRAVAEPIVAGSAHLAPSRTPAVRRTVEMMVGVCFYGGVLLFLLRLFLSS